MKRVKLSIRVFGIFLALTALLSCDEEYTPKPKAYQRINLPKQEYLSTERENWTCPYGFEYSEQSVITVDPRYKDSTCWYNIYYPDYRATIHLTYSHLNQNLNKHLEESRKLAMKHIGKASQIDELLISQSDKDVYGIVYDFKGETASDLQFFLTDSTTHFLRGALYFNVAPNKDSLAPVINYVKSDLRHLIDHFEWRW